MLSVKEIYELSSGVEYHLKQLEDFVPALREVKASLDEIRHSQEGKYQWEVTLLRREIEEIKTQLKRYGLPEASKYERELKELQEALSSDNWPPAVDPSAIVDTDDQATERAEVILDIVVGEQLADRKFLDFGCGKGHVAVAAHKRKAQAVGYDIDLQCTLEGPIFTNDFETTHQNGPYEIILLHDVLDHIKVVDPITAMQQVRAMLTDNGKVYVRNHPWCARHGGHLYQKLNKAFAHLVFDEVELVRIGGYESEHNIKVTRPLETYRHWFQESGFEIASEIPIKKEVEPIFLQSSFLNYRIAEKWQDRPTEMSNDMEIEFVEYILEASGTLPTAGLI
jgi:2-polyprenyl-3-methyl-5-hydroxy-6-metoxy-1,4-benzoquinol methylase